MIKKPTSPQIESLISEIYAALEHRRHHTVRDQLRRLEDWLPNDPDAIKLRLWAALLEFDCGLKRNTQRCLSRLPPRLDQVELVYFHVDVPGPRNREYKDIDYFKVLQQSLEVARHRIPQARRILLTDRKTSVPDSIGIEEVRRYDINVAFLMYERMRVQSRHLEARDQSCASIFLDVDVVANRDPTSIFVSDFDIGLTWRADILRFAPINGGIILVGPGARGHNFFANALQCYEALSRDKGISSFFSQDLRAWWGDQLVLAIMSSYGPFDESQLIDGALVSFFPSTEYNCL
jgi:hypothetical protein